jgi:LacI family transcriptional regulator
MKKTVTINDIAKIANVSRGTVDRVVNNRGYVAKDKLQRIQKIIDDLNFVPNIHGRNLALNKSLNIGLVLPEHTEMDYWVPFIYAAKNFNANYLHLGVKIICYYYDQNRLDLFKDIEKEIFSANVDAILTSKPQNSVLVNFLSKCSKKEIPFILLGSDNTNYKSLSNLGQDAFRSGRLAAELINFRQDQNATYIVFNLFNEHNINNNVVTRIEGFKDYFMENNNPKMNVEVIEINIDDPMLVDKIKERINSLSEKDGIFIPNSKSHLIAKFVDKDKIKRFVGFDLVKANTEYLEKGTINFLINQKPYDQAYQGLEILYRYLGTKQQPLDIILIPHEIITRENLSMTRVESNLV